jgi:hypothetical protein
MKNEMPIGSRVRGTPSGCTPNPVSSALTLSAKKLAYLKMPRTTRFTVTARASSGAAAGVWRARSTAMAIPSLKAIDPSISPVKEPPPFA